MLQRFFIHLSLIFLFAFVQLGAVTHEYSHTHTQSQQSQPDKNSAAGHCAQCIAYAQTATGIQSSTFNLSPTIAHFALISSESKSYSLALSAHYHARAPPYNSNS